MPPLDTQTPTTGASPGPAADAEGPRRPRPGDRVPADRPGPDRVSTTAKVWLIALAALCLAGVAVIAVTRRPAPSGVDVARPDTGRWRGTELRTPTPRPDFTLTDTAGQPYDFGRETAGRYTMLFFGYTNCPDVCPIHMATLAAALRQNPGLVPTVVFVTTDPDRDTPEKLRTWLDGFDTAFIGLTGTKEQVALAQQRSGVAVATVTATDGDGRYSVGHAAEVLAFTPDDQAHLAYPFGTRTEDWVHDLSLLAGERQWTRP